MTEFNNEVYLEDFENMLSSKNNLLISKVRQAVSNLKTEISKFLTTAKESNLTTAQKNRLKNYLLTDNIKKVSELLSADMVAAYLTCHVVAVRNILFPLLYEYFNSYDLKRSEKVEKLKEIEKGYKMAVLQYSEEDDEEDARYAEGGIIEFEKNVNDIIYPYCIKIK